MCKKKIHLLFQQTPDYFKSITNNPLPFQILNEYMSTRWNVKSVIQECALNQW